MSENRESGPNNEKPKPHPEMENPSERRIMSRAIATGLLPPLTFELVDADGQQYFRHVWDVNENGVLQQVEDSASNNTAKHVGCPEMATISDSRGKSIQVHADGTFAITEAEGGPPNPTRNKYQNIVRTRDAGKTGAPLRNNLSLSSDPKVQTHLTSEQRKLIEEKMSWAKAKFEDNNGGLDPVCFVVHPRGIEAITVTWSDRSEKHAAYQQLSQIASDRCAETLLFVSDMWEAKVDRNDETGLPARYRSNRTELLNADLIAPDGSVIAMGRLPYVRLEEQIIWGKLEIVEPDPAKRVRLHQCMIPRWDIPAIFGYGGPKHVEDIH